MEQGTAALVGRLCTPLTQLWPSLILIDRKGNKQINTSTCSQRRCIVTGYLPTLLVPGVQQKCSQTSTFRARFSVAISDLIYYDDPIRYNTTTLSFNFYCALIKVSICLLVREITGSVVKNQK